MKKGESTFEKEVQLEAQQEKNETEQAQKEPTSYLENKKEEFSVEWKELVNEEDTAETKRRKNNDLGTFLVEMSGAAYSPRPAPRSPEEIDAQFSAYKDIKEFLYNLPPEYQTTSLIYDENDIPEKGQKCLPTRTFESRFFQIASRSHDPEQSIAYCHLFKNCLEKVDPQLFEELLDAVGNYGIHHNLTEQSVRGFEKKLLPALENKDPQVAVLQRRTNTWGMKRGDFGLGDFTVASYGSEVNPKNINQLLMALREIPTSNMAKLEQNRKDALELRGSFGALRDFIHDQRPLVREVIRAMVKYHDTHDKSELQSLLPQTEGYLSWDERQKIIYDLSRYDKTVETHDGKKEPVIDVLKRLEENTKITEEVPPETSDAELNKAMQELSEGKFLDKNLLQKAMDRINSQLEDMQDKNEVGIEPNMILAIAWLERKGYKAVKDMHYEDQLSAYAKPWFHSVLKFQELTASAQLFDKEEFDGFIAKLNSSKDLKGAYGLVMDRTLKNVSGLASVYMQSSKPHITGALWSGNLAHELTALTDLKPADSIMGKKHRKEQEAPLEFKNTGD